MAGNYPDVPGHRFVMDRDGTQIYRISPTNVVTQATPAEVAAMVDETFGEGLFSGSDRSAYTRYLTYFPEPRTVSGIFLGSSANSVAVDLLEYSANTTTGLDGTWDTLAATAGTYGEFGYGSVVPEYRNLIIPVSASGVKAVRWSTKAQGTGYSGTHWTVHIYGSIPTTGSPDRLAIWHPTLDEPIDGAYFDWGDSPRSSSADRTFRVKNLSASLTANDITLSFDALTDGSPSVAGMHLVSDDGTTFAATETISSLGPGVISSVMTMRRVLSSDAPLGPWAPRIHAIADSWS